MFDADEQLHFKGKKVSVESGTGFVNFVGLIKAVCRHDQNSLNSERFWKRLEPEISKSDSKLINKILFISPSAVDKLVEQNFASCKKTWGVFNDDGYQQFSRDLKLCKDGKYSVSTSVETNKKRSIASPSGKQPESSKKVRVLVQEDDDKITEENVKEFLEVREYVLNEREGSINKREELVLSREKILISKEVLMMQRETEYAESLKKLEKEQARLEKKKSEMGDPEMSTFFEQISSLTNKFKAKRQASRRNSSDDEDNRSPTPELTDKPENTNKQVVPSDDDSEELPVKTYNETEKKKEKKKEKKRDESPTPSRSPSPIPLGSPERTATPSKKSPEVSRNTKTNTKTNSGTNSPTEKSTPVQKK